MEVVLASRIAKEILHLSLWIGVQVWKDPSHPAQIKELPSAIVNRFSFQMKAYSATKQGSILQIICKILLLQEENLNLKEVI